MARHTPGPWTICRTLLDGVAVRWHIASQRDGSAYPIAEHEYEGHPDAIEQDANARLIAAAPDLLEAARLGESAISDYCSVADSDDPAHEILVRVRSAIRKAERGTEGE